MIKISTIKVHAKIEIKIKIEIKTKIKVKTMTVAWLEALPLVPRSVRVQAVFHFWSNDSQHNQITLLYLMAGSSTK